jgi:beta propeller repeat protein
MYDITQENLIQITSDDESQYKPTIYEDKIVWIEEINGNAEIILYNINNGQKTQLTTSAGRRGRDCLRCSQGICRGLQETDGYLSG